MPYLLADEWFEAKLNSVSLSFQRQMMGKPDSKKGNKKKEEQKQVVGSPATRSRVGAVAGATMQTQVDVHGEPKEKTKSSRSVKGSEAGSDRGSGKSKSSVPAVALDIPNIIKTALARVANGEHPSVIAQDMPRHHKQWKERSVRNHVKNMKAKLHREHWQALGLEEETQGRRLKRKQARMRSARTSSSD